MLGCVYRVQEYDKEFFMNNVCAASEPAKSRIMAIYEQLNVLGNEVVQLQKVANENRKKYFGSPDVPDVPAGKEERKDGTVNDIDWMIDDILRMVLDIRKYVEIL
jgi:hypothetical protein